MVILITASIGKRIVNKDKTAGSQTSAKVSLLAFIIVSPETEINPIANGSIVAITIREIAINITCFMFVAKLKTFFKLKNFYFLLI